MPLAVISFEPVLFVYVSALVTLYQFWIRTEFIGKLGPLEWVLNTPSHHRVHHGRNPRHLLALWITAGVVAGGGLLEGRA